MKSDVFLIVTASFVSFFKSKLPPTLLSPPLLFCVCVCVCVCVHVYFSNVYTCTCVHTQREGMKMAICWNLVLYTVKLCYVKSHFICTSLFFRHQLLLLLYTSWTAILLMSFAFLSLTCGATPSLPWSTTNEQKIQLDAPLRSSPQCDTLSCHFRS